MEMTELLVWTSETYKIETVKGRIPYRDWLQQEKDRITSDPTRIAEIREKVGLNGTEISLWVNKIT